MIQIECLSIRCDVRNYVTFATNDLMSASNSYQINANFMKTHNSDSVHLKNHIHILCYDVKCLSVCFLLRTSLTDICCERHFNICNGALYTMLLALKLDQLIRAGARVISIE